MTSLWLGQLKHFTKSSNTDNMLTEFSWLYGSMNLIEKILKVTSNFKSLKDSWIWSWAILLIVLTKPIKSINLINNWKILNKHGNSLKRSKEMKNIFLLKFNQQFPIALRILNYWRSFRNGVQKLSFQRLF